MLFFKIINQEKWIQRAKYQRILSYLLMDIILENNILFDLIIDTFK